MKLSEGLELIAAWSAQRPGKWGGLAALAAKIDAELGGAEWAAMAAADPAEGGFGLVALLGGTVVRRLRWDGRAGVLRDERRYGARRGGITAVSYAPRGAGARAREERAAPFSAALFASPELAERFRLFARRCPVAAVESEWEKGSATGAWRLRLREPEPWARLLRLDAAVPFGPEAAAFSLIFAGRGVRALAWEGESLWAELAA